MSAKSTEQLYKYKYNQTCLQKAPNNYTNTNIIRHVCKKHPPIVRQEEGQFFCNSIVMLIVDVSEEHPGAKWLCLLIKF